jgi:hypothetical protein
MCIARALTSRSGGGKLLTASLLVQAWRPRCLSDFTAKRLQNSAQGGGFAEPWVFNVKGGPPSQGTWSNCRATRAAVAAPVRRRTFKSVFLPRIAPAQRVGDAEGAEENARPGIVSPSSNIAAFIVLRWTGSFARSELRAFTTDTQGSAKPPPWAILRRSFAAKNSHR